MTQPKVSVIIPVYNGADYLGKAIQSVLDQTYSNFEIIIVSDASTDHSSEVINSFNDPRLKFLVHEKNKGLPATRNTAIKASSGELLTLLDQDDIFHPKKLEAHVDFLDKHPNIGATYNSRFEIGPTGNILSVWRPPMEVGHADFVLGFPFAPSDMTVRRDWIDRVGLFDEYYTFGGEDLDITCRLALAKCKFVGVDQILNYRRFYPNRILRNPARGFDGALHALKKTFTDARCSPLVKSLQSKAFSISYMIWSYEAFIKQETSLGQELIQQAIQFDRSILNDQASKFIDFLIERSSRDGSEHEIFLQHVFSQLPPDLNWISKRCSFTIAHGYLNRGVREIIWGQPHEAAKCLTKAAEMGAKLDEAFLRFLNDQLRHHEGVFGSEATQTVLQNLTQQLLKVGTPADTRWLNSCFFINRAFRDYRNNLYETVPDNVFKAVSLRPFYLTDRGVISILIRSSIYQFFHRFASKQKSFSSS